MSQKSFDHLFREEYGKLISSLLYILGPSRIDEAENIAQDALVKAMKNWPIHGWPENPGAWLRKAAKNMVMDFYRSKAVFEKNKDTLSEDFGDKELDTCDLAMFDNFIDREVLDDQLRMIFLSCHQSFSLEDRVILSLKTIGGLGVEEIAAGLLMKKPAVAQRLVRLKKKIKEENISLSYPDPEEVEKRVDNVLSTIYLIFNEGYKVTEGGNLYDLSLCRDAVRLLNLIIAHFENKISKASSLMALFLFQTSRFSSRVDENAKTILLKDQEREKWDWAMISVGFEFLERGMKAKKLSSYHIEAGIAALHCSAKSYDETNWPKILEYYDILLKLKPNPAVFLNRVIAFAEVHGAEKGIKELEKLKDNRRLESYYYLDTTLADFYYRLKDFKRAETHYLKALDNIKNKVEQDFIKERLEEIKLKFI